MVIHGIIIKKYIQNRQKREYLQTLIYNHNG